MKFDIIKNRSIWFGFSSVLIVVSLILVGMGNLKLGIDFTGGSLVSIDINDDLDFEEFSGIFADTIGQKGQQINETGSGFDIRYRDSAPEDLEKLDTALTEKGINFEVTRTYSINPTFSSAFTERALYALGIAIVAIVLYVAFAFRRVPRRISPWKFGLAAIAALVHDVLITVGVFALLGMMKGIEIDGLFITALLTVMGFSVHDTIVVFDRVRENLKGKSSEAFPEVAEKALWQTMRRSINTSISTLVVLLALMILGSPTIFYFLLALVIGIVAGTYSSIFIATPLLVAWQKK